MRLHGCRAEFSYNFANARTQVAPRLRVGVVAGFARELVVDHLAVTVATEIIPVSQRVGARVQGVAALHFHSFEILSGFNGTVIEVQGRVDGIERNLPRVIRKSVFVYVELAQVGRSYERLPVCVQNNAALFETVYDRDGLPNVARGSKHFPHLRSVRRKRAKIGSYGWPGRAAVYEIVEISDAKPSVSASG